MKKRLSILSASLFSCVLLIVGTVIYYTVQSRIFAAKQSELKNQAQAIAQYYADFASDFGTPKENGRWVSAFLQHDQKVVVMSADIGKRIQVGQLPIQSPNLYFQRVNHVIQREIKGPEFSYGLYTQVPVYGDTPKSGPIAYIQVFSGLYSLHHYMNTLLAVLILCCIFGIAVSAVGGYFITTLSLKPLTKLANSIERIGIQNLRERIHLTDADREITRVARTFNQMAERLEHAFAQQEQFVADASHEIRTPLTSILGHSDRIARWGDTRPEVLQSSTRVIQKETLRLQKLVDDLLTLARRNGPERFTQTYAALDEVVREVVADYLPVYENIRITTELNANCPCNLAPELLRRVIVNILSNAVKFTPPGGSIEIVTLRKKTFTVVEVQDTGCGIQAEDLPYIFDRFYRVDKARERRQGGNGLGLAIVKEIISSSGGEITVNSELQKGTLVRIQIPIHEGIG